MAGRVNPRPNSTRTVMSAKQKLKITGYRNMAGEWVAYTDKDREDSTRIMESAQKGFADFALPVYRHLLPLVIDMLAAAPPTTSYAYKTIEEYEKYVDFKTNLAFKMGWNMGRVTNAQLGITGE